MKKINLFIVAIFCLCLLGGCNSPDEQNYGQPEISLLEAAQEGNISAVKYYITHGENINRENEKGYTPLMLASENGREDIAEFLIKKGADINTKSLKDGQTALILASENSHIEIVKMLIKAGADVNAQNDEGQTSLMHASRLGDITVKALISVGADVNAKDKNSKTPLMFAKENDYPEIAQTLIDAGAKE
jgi:serine/threonine-protein phosphatase 6 regulatory ankyrin repeat subunit B